MTAEEFLAKREAYTYPAVALAGSIESWTEISFKPTWQLDGHQHNLLTSHDEAETVLGYLSTVFWGHFSGQDGRTRGPRAQAKAKRALAGIGNGATGGVAGAARRIREALALVESERCSEALKLLAELPELGPVFASKVGAFLSPTKCGVVDATIAGKYPRFGFSVNNKGYVKNTASNLKQYDSYCAFLREQADQLNQKGDGFLWKDRDSTRQRWRAVDVERAIFSSNPVAQ